MKFKCRLLVVLLPLLLGACANLTALLGAAGMASSNSSAKDTASNRNSPNAARSALVKDNATCCIGGGADCDCDLEKDKQIVYVDKPIEECTRSVRTVKQVDTCPTCSPFPVAVRERGSCASH